jgi:hypothetical protein
MTTTTKTVSNEDYSKLLDSLLGTWTLETHVKADLGYYKAKAFMVMHFMPDPLQIYGCRSKHCRELDNEVCQQGECVNTEDSTVEWSDGTLRYVTLLGYVITVY